ncbi:MAG: Holliday junction resolvase RuvX [Thermoanaerobaculaceae bacterium]|jgi:putative Holliday junction resolvase
MRWLALDIGSRRVGVAVCDADEQLATPLRAIAYSGPERLAEAVEELGKTWAAEGVVVGMPHTRAGNSRGEVRVSRVVAALERRFEGPVETVDESGTTAAAEAQLAEAGVPHRRWEELVDSLAARLILEAHLASRRNQA